MGGSDNNALNDLILQFPVLAALQSLPSSLDAAFSLSGAMTGDGTPVVLELTGGANGQQESLQLVFCSSNSECPGEFSCNGICSNTACPSDHPFLYGALCYDPCPSGYDMLVAGICYQQCPTDGTYTDSGLDCLGCPAGYYSDGAGMCYPNCRDGYTGIAGVCWGSCPAGYNDYGERACLAKLF
jgi:hypothetical protein